ncbi:glycosyl hydrolase 115 family protein [Catenovulum sediminis]|uniref:glycosyl hydrolase 115 family protein n=1 Tax=Catenovulum sediminis TaxID=1740262 RepID=UPI00117F1C0E|nr:glycosyl hydrolase 115 family protein [Catenovulum sediminis]
MNLSKLKQQICLLAALLCSLLQPVFAFGVQQFIYADQSATDTKQSMVIVGQSNASIFVAANESKGVLRAAQDLQDDLQAVTGQKLPLINDLTTASGNVIVIATIGQSQLLKQLEQAAKINLTAIDNQWDAYQIQLANDISPKIKKALIIAGSNKRGAIYGTYDISEQAGVSPWYYWADIPVKKSKTLFSQLHKPIVEIPKVKYRGIFLNDEAPALTNWVNKNFGGYNHQFYVNVFELMLRLKANYLWPAMWNNAFADDDRQNMVLADEYGIVMGTSHHEPMMRADKEWDRDGEGEWQYSTNRQNLYQFWQRGVKRNAPYESLYTLGMRGREDSAMQEGENIKLLEQIVADQRRILAKQIKDKNLQDIPQVWCLYKEVQAFYEKGMRVPDDVILLWADDNWGNIRRLPTQAEQARSGGAGVYYHFDYVGGPRSYRWINVTPIAKIWEQMNQAYIFNANQIWITNVGDLKPMEYPTEFFLKMAWDPTDFNQNNLDAYGIDWATRYFGSQYAEQINQLVKTYTRHNQRRKPELMSADVYSQIHYNEADRIEQELNEAVALAESLYHKIDKTRQDAFFQLVLHPVKATAIVSKLYFATAKNRLYAMQGRVNANKYATLARTLFAKDAALKAEYDSINQGKWQHFMDQPHIGYNNWNNPAADTLPVLYEYQPHPSAEMGLTVEGSAASFPDTGSFNLEFDSMGLAKRGIELYNRGLTPYKFNVQTSADWIKLNHLNGEVTDHLQLQVSIDWRKLPAGQHKGSISIKGTSWQAAQIHITANKAPQKLTQKATGFVEADGYVAINAANFSQANTVEGYRWQVIKGLGRTADTISVFPKSYRTFDIRDDHPVVEYPVSFFSTGQFAVEIQALPTLSYFPDRTPKLGISVNNGPVRVIELDLSTKKPAWGAAVSEGIRKIKTNIVIDKAGQHTIQLHNLDLSVGVERILIDTGGLKPSYLGPPESQFK